MQKITHVNIKPKYLLRAVLYCAVFTLLLVAFALIQAMLTPQHERLVYGLLGTLAGFLATAIFLRFDRLTFADIGLKPDRGTFQRFVIGLVTGILIMGILVFTVIQITHMDVSVNDQSSLAKFLVATAPLLPLAFMEELGFRGYPLEILKNRIGIRTSILVTSVLFAIYHIANGWSIASSFYGPATWGLVFGLAAVYSKGIAMPTGLHYAANLTTSAFGDKNTSPSLWILTPPGAAPLPSEINWAAIIPAAIVLLFGVMGCEFYLRRRPTKVQ